VRRSSSFNTHRIDHIYQDPHTPNVRLFLHYGDLSDGTVLNEILLEIKPDEIYNLAAQSHVRTSFDIPEYTGDVAGLGVTRILEAIRTTGINTKFYQASSSEMFGSAKAPQSENSIFSPRSPYAAAKLYAYWITVNYRESYDMFACNGILFNHESPRRGETFVTRKITRALANILKGNQKKIYLGNLNAKRDWGFAPDYVEAMWAMLQESKPDDYVIGTGSSFSVRQFVERAFGYVGITVGWTGKGIQEKGVVKHADAMWKHILKRNDIIIEIDPRYFRPTEVECLKANYSKARKKLGWSPRIVFDELVKIMVDYDMKLSGLESPGEGVEISRKKEFRYTNHDLSFYERIREGA
jgi:GDPmannose 4,6-dehydratase